MCYIRLHLKNKKRTRKMAVLIRVLVALEEDMLSVPSTHSSPFLQFHGTQCLHLLTTCMGVQLAKVRAQILNDADNGFLLLSYFIFSF